MDVLPKELTQIIHKRSHELRFSDVMTQLTDSCIFSIRDEDEPLKWTVDGYYNPHITMTVTSSKFNHSILINSWSIPFNIGNRICNSEDVQNTWAQFVRDGMYPLHFAY